MSFKNFISWGKTTKIVTIVAMALGGGLTIGGAAMLGVSGNRTYYTTSQTGNDASGNPIMSSMEFGVGFSNYGKITINGQELPKSTSFASYEDFIKQWKQAVEMAPPGTPAAIIDLYKTAIQTYDIMVAGAVLLPIGTIIAVLGVVFFILNNKKA